DAGQLPESECPVVGDRRDVPAGCCCVPGEEVRSSGEAGQRGRGHAEERLVAVFGLGPVDQQEPEIGERVAESADLPIQDGQHVALVVQDGVVQPVVPVDDGHTLLLGDLCGQQLVDPVDDGGPRLAVDGRLGGLPVAPLELAGGVNLPAGGGAQPPGGDGDG